MIKEIIIWKNHKHPCLLKFIAGCVWDRPKFIVSDYCENGNAVDYLQSNPKSDRAKLVRRLITYSVIRLAFLTP